MDKLALSKRLAGFSEVFKNETPFFKDLKAMSVALEHLPEEKFASLLKQAEEEAKEEAKKEPEKKVEEEKEAAKKEEKAEAPKEEKAEEKAEEKEPEEEAKEEAKEEMDKEASVVGTFWNKEASEAVKAFLLHDVVGEQVSKKAAETVPAAKLSTDQIPDGKGNKPAATLKAEQVPKMEEVLKSGIVEKSHGSVRKEASEKVTVVSSEGVELSAGMDEAILSSEEADKLSILFG